MGSESRRSGAVSRRVVWALAAASLWGCSAGVTRVSVVRSGLAWRNYGTGAFVEVGPVDYGGPSSGRGMGFSIGGSLRYEDTGITNGVDTGYPPAWRAAATGRWHILRLIDVQQTWHNESRVDYVNQYGTVDHSVTMPAGFRAPGEFFDFGLMADAGVGAHGHFGLLNSAGAFISGGYSGMVLVVEGGYESTPFYLGPFVRFGLGLQGIFLNGR